MRLIAGFDLETTGLLEPEHKIIELALILYDLDSAKKVGSMVRRWNPGRPIDPKAQEVHGITFDQVAHLPMLRDDMQSIEKIEQIAKSTLFWVAHNGKGFDKPFIEQEWRSMGRVFPEIEVCDTMLEGRWATPYGKSPNLGELCFACRVPYDPTQAHAAEYDVERMADCFFYAQKRGFISLPQRAAGAW